MQPDHGTAATLAFGPFALDTERHLLMRDGETVKLGARDIDLLMALVAQAGRVVSHATLDATLWPHSVVEDSSMQVRIAGLRRRLGDGAAGGHGAGRYIVNVPGRGYSFVAVLAPPGGGHELPHPAAAALAQMPHLPPGP